MGFKDMVAADNKNVFLNPDEFAELRTIVYDGKTFKDIPVVLTVFKEQNRRPMAIQHGQSDNAQGLFMVTSVLHCALSDLGGKKPEKEHRIKINGEEGGGGFYNEFYIATSKCEMGMLRVELEEIDE